MLIHRLCERHCRGHEKADGSPTFGWPLLRGGGVDRCEAGDSLRCHADALAGLVAAGRVFAVLASFQLVWGLVAWSRQNAWVLAAGIAANVGGRIVGDVPSVGAAGRAVGRSA